MDSKGIVPCLSSDSVEIHREEEAFSLISLVADIGGILGLFIGFNFLMVWDWILWGIRKLWQRNFLEGVYFCLKISPTHVQ